VVKFLSAVSHPLGIKDVQPHSTQVYHKGWQQAWEVTGSSASGIYFGRYIAGTFNPEILVVNMAMVDIPLCTGFTYE